MLGRALLFSKCCPATAARHSFVGGVASSDLAEAVAGDGDDAFGEPAVAVGGGGAAWSAPSVQVRGLVGLYQAVPQREGLRPSIQEALAALEHARLLLCFAFDEDGDAAARRAADTCNSAAWSAGHAGAALAGSALCRGELGGVAGARDALGAVLRTFWEGPAPLLPSGGGAAFPESLGHGLNELDDFVQGLPVDLAGMPFALFYPAQLSGGLCAFEGHAGPLFDGDLVRDASGRRSHEPWLDVTNTFTQHLSATSLLRTLHLQGFPLSRTVLNYGAFDVLCAPGPQYDPANCLLADVAKDPRWCARGPASGAWKVVMAERSAAHAEEMRKALRSMPFPSCGGAGSESLQALVAEVEVTPENAAPLLQSWRLSLGPVGPERRWPVDLLKLDMDSGDCRILRRLLPVVDPLLIHAEVLPFLPPAVGYAPDPAAPGGGEPGAWSACSLGAYLELLGQGSGHRTWALASLEFENALFVRRDVAEAFFPWVFRSDSTHKWALGYFCHPLARAFEAREFPAEDFAAAFREQGYPFRQPHWSRRRSSAASGANASELARAAFGGALLRAGAIGLRLRGQAEGPLTSASA